MAPPGSWPVTVHTPAAQVSGRMRSRLRSHKYRLFQNASSCRPSVLPLNWADGREANVNSNRGLPQCTKRNEKQNEAQLQHTQREQRVPKRILPFGTPLAPHLHRCLPLHIMEAKGLMATCVSDSAATVPVNPYRLGEAKRTRAATRPFAAQYVTRG